MQTHRMFRRDVRMVSFFPVHYESSRLSKKERKAKRTKSTEGEQRKKKLHNKQ